MPTLNILTWNSNGETQQAAHDLQGVIVTLNQHGWVADAIVIQEANAAPGGYVYQMLSGLGGVYNAQPTHTTEGSPGGRGYLLLTRTNIGGQNTFANYNLAADVGLQAWMNASLSLPARQIANQELATMQRPATATLTGGGGVRVSFMTWHTPRGPGQVLQGATLQGGANPDGYLFLQNSTLYGGLTAPGVGNLGVVAGDLNVTYNALNTNTGIPALPRILPSFVGVSSNLDHIVGDTQAGQPAPTFPLNQAGNYQVPSSPHAVLYGQANW
jgi:hypothetical protein